MSGEGTSRKRRPPPPPNAGASSSPSPPSEEAGRWRSSSGKNRSSHRAGDGEKASRKEGKRSRRDEDKDRTSRKGSAEKSRKRSREDREEKKRTKKEKKSRGKEKHRSSGEKASGSFEELSKDDYFLKNNEFSTWLKEEKGMFFSELSSEKARELFSGFIKEWNNRKLQPRYYEGIASGPRTGHDWNIKT